MSVFFYLSVYCTLTYASVQFVDETAEVIEAYERGIESPIQIYEPGSNPPSLASYSAASDDWSKVMLGQSIDRCWPLIDATEILLLEHFTHNLSKFVSDDRLVQVFRSPFD